MYGEYFRALKLPGTPVKTFRLHIFLFKAAEEPYTPEDLEAEARYLQLIPRNSRTASVAGLVFDSDASSTGGASAAIDAFGASMVDGDYPDGIHTPSTVADAEWAWEAGFKAGQEAAMLASEGQWAEVLRERMAHLAQTASEFMLEGAKNGEGFCSKGLQNGRLSPALGLAASGSLDRGGKPAVSVHMTDAADLATDLEFQSMFESKYDVSESSRRMSGQGLPGSNQRVPSPGQVSPLRGPSPGLLASPPRDITPSKRGEEYLKNINQSDLHGVLSPNTLLPAHISIFGDDLGEAEALAAVQEFGPPPAAAANLPSHISEFGGLDDEDERDDECDPEAEAMAVARAALPEEDMTPLADRMKRNNSLGRGPKRSAPDAALLPMASDLLGLEGRPGSVRNDDPIGAAMRHPPPAALCLPSALDATLSNVHHVDSGALTVLGKIGEGAFGEVSLCQCPTFGRVAVKWIKSSKMERWASFWREAELMSRLNHPNVLRFYGLVTKGDCVVGIMTEFAGGGSLATFLRRGDREHRTRLGDVGAPAFLPLHRRAHLALHATNGIAYLHSQRVVHFDVKPDNLLVDGDWSSPDGPTLKVADFGLSVVKANTFCSDVHDLRGTLPYMAPEMITDHRHVTEAADVWSLGVVLWELLTQQQPFADVAPAVLLGALGSGTARLPIPEWCEPEWRAVMEACWIEDPALRPTCRQLTMQLQRIRDNALPP